MFNEAVIFAFLAMVSWGVGDFFIQRSTRKIGNVQSLAWIGIIGTIGLLPLALKDLHLLQISGNLVFIIGLGVITFITAMFNFQALKEGKLSVIEVILEAELPITIALGIIFLKEVLTLSQLIIIILIILGVFLTSTKSFQGLRSRIEKGVFLALVTAVFYGVINVLVGVSSKTISPVMTIWGSWTVFTVISLAIIFIKGDTGSFIQKGFTNGRLVLLMGIIDTLAWFFYALAVSKSGISVITAITESYPALAMYLGIVFNKEKVRLHQYAGAAIAIVCSVILSTTI